MELYTSKDIDLFEKHIDNIKINIDTKIRSLFGPSIDEIKEIYDCIKNFIKKKQRKIYGGFALNLYILEKNPDDAIYSDTDYPDIEFYSPEPKKDLIELCNLFYDQKYSDIIGFEAQHQDTFTISINFQKFCDITYVPRNIYNKMPFKMVDGFNLIHTNFMTVDYLRMLADPIGSYWRFDKAIMRFILINKYFPLPHITHNIKVKKNKYNNIIDKIIDCVKNKITCIIIGIAAFNFFIKESGINKKYITNISVPVCEIISTNFKNDCVDIINMLKDSDSDSDVTVTEYYPFFQFIGHSARIYFKGVYVAKIIHYDRVCRPYQVIPYNIFTNDKSKNKNIIQIGTFTLTLLFSLMNVFQARAEDNKEESDLWYAICSQLIESRNYFFSKTKLTYFDESYFKDFTLNCTGYALTSERAKAALIKDRLKKRQKTRYDYRPNNEIILPDSVSNNFANTSGNEVVNKNNLKITNLIKNNNSIIENDMLDNDVDTNDSVETEPDITDN